MRWRLSLGLTLALGLLVATSLPAAERGTPPTTELQAEVTRQRHVVLPRPDPASVSTDVAEATAAIPEWSRQEEGPFQEARRPLPRRPDLDPTVSGGVQSRNLQRALRR
jgi:hypothetical protein